VAVKRGENRAGKGASRAAVETMKIALSVAAKEAVRGPESPYFKALVAAGARPEEIQMVMPGAAEFSSFDDFDGVLLAGGEDVDPDLYGEPVKYSSVKVNRARDDFEMALLDRGIRARVPILGICRGIQTINVKFGGTLYQDLKTDTTLERDHRQQGSRSEPAHSVTVTDPDSLLHDIFTGQRPVNSLHHQAIKRLGRGLKVTAHSEDGLVEAVEMAEEYPFFLAVQWHPEEMVATHPEQLRIFERFVAHCRERAAKRMAASR
jgi:putative glutamine amidotransferase